jgi:periplasmic mercuric ion binding protein
LTKRREVKQIMRILIVMAAVFAFILGGFINLAWSADQTIQLKVEGMTCAMCPPAVSKALKGVKGVKSAEVSLEDKKAVVIVEEEVKTDDLLEAVKGAGHFDAQVLK